MFPIRNAKGDIIAFGGRAMGDAQPKYMNSPQTPLFDKSRVLYGYDLAHEAIRRGEAAVIVEGYVDVIMAHQYGFRNVVAPLGTALTPQHVDSIKRLARRVYLALDADAAGIRAAIKGVQTLQDQADGELVAITSPHGVVGLQRSQSVEIRVIALPEGQDPDEVIQGDPAMWQRLVDDAQPAMEFYIRALTSDLELGSARGKAQAVERLAPLLAQVTNPVEHAYYIQQIARLIDIDEQSILRALPQSREGARSARSQPPPLRPHQRPAEGSAAVAGVDAPSQREEHLLCWVMRYPSARDAVQEKLRRDLAPFALVQRSIGDSILDLLQRVEHRAIWSAWEQAPAGAEIDRWAERLDEALRPVALRVLSHRLPDPQAYRYVNDALECATILQQYQAQRWHKRFRHEAHEAADNEARAQALEMIVQLQEYLGMISAPRRSSTYADLHNLHSV
jgi:DNA primase